MSLKPHSLTQRIVRGFGAQAYAQLLQIVLRFGEVPAFLYLWNADQYGRWLIISTLPAYLGFADGGLATTAGRSMTMRLADNDQNGAVGVFQTSALFLLAISAALTAITAIVLLFYNHLSVLMELKHLTPDITYAILVLSVSVGLGYFIGIYYGAFSALGRYGTATIVLSNTSAGELVLSLVGVVATGSLTGAALGLVVARLLGVIYFQWFLRKLAPFFRLGRNFASWTELRDLAAPSLGSLAFPIGLAGNLSGMRALVGIVLGPAAIPAFAAMRTLARLVQFPTLFVIRILEPELAIAFGAKDLATCRLLLKNASRGVLWLSAGLGLTLLFLGRYFYWKWLSDKVLFDAATFNLLITASAVNGLWYVALQIPYATNRAHVIAVPFSLIYGVFCLALGWALMLLIGLSGAALAIVIVELVMLVIVLPRSLNLIGEALPAFMGAVMRFPTAQVRWVVARLLRQTR